jgi:hypothetical protein
LPIIAVIRLLLGILAFRGARWAYLGFITLGLLYFPLKVGFNINPRACQLVFDAELATHSLRNYGHIVLFAVFFVMTRAQFPSLTPATVVWCAVATILMGALVELAQGVSGEGNCRARDLIPDSLGAAIGSVIVLILHKAGWKPRPRWALW